MKADEIAAQIQRIGEQIIPLQAEFQKYPEGHPSRAHLKEEIVELKANRSDLFADLDVAKASEVKK